MAFAMFDLTLKNPSPLKNSIVDLEPDLCSRFLFSKPNMYTISG